MEADSGYRMWGVMGRRGAPQSIYPMSKPVRVLSWDSYTVSSDSEGNYRQPQTWRNVKILRQVGQRSEDKVGQQALEGSSMEHTEAGCGQAGAKGTKRHQTENPASPSAQTAMFTMNNRLWFLSGFYFPPVLGIKPMA